MLNDGIADVAAWHLFNICNAWIVPRSIGCSGAATTAQAIDHRNAVDTVIVNSVDRVWKNDEDANPEVVWVYVSYLRQKLRSIGSTVKIESEKGGSYELVK